jgi:uncharacterized damage-inducible protein DinB
MPFSQTILPEFDQEMKNTRKILECVPDGKLDYQPHPKSMSMARLATHVAELPGWASTTVDVDVLDMPPGFKPRIAQSRAELLEIFDKAVAEARPKIEATSDEKWQQLWTFKFAGNTVLSMPRAAVLRSVVMNHLIHHRAQLGVFLRLNDVAIPGMYGPSADENTFAQAAG